MIASAAGTPPPFEFWKSPYLVEVTPLRATSLGQLLTGVTLASDWSLFFHLHQRFFWAPDRLPEYPNDFAAWTHEVLGEDEVAERLANLNLVRSVGLAQVRREISLILAQHLSEAREERQASANDAFIFCKPRMVAYPTGRRARTPAEFVRVLRTADSDSVAYHLFFARRFNSQRAWDDIVVWFKQWGYTALAEQLEAFDPYLNSLEDSRDRWLALIERGLPHSERSQENA